MTTYTASAAAPGYKGRRQAPFSPPVVRWRTDPSPFCETNPSPSRLSRREPPERNKPIFVRRASGAAALLRTFQNETNPFLATAAEPRSPRTKQTHFRPPGCRRRRPATNSPERNKPIFSNCCRATIPQNETNPFSSARLRVQPPSRQKPPERNKPILGLCSRATNSPLRNKPIFGTAETAALPQGGNAPVVIPDPADASPTHGCTPGTPLRPLYGAPSGSRAARRVLRWAMRSFRTAMAIARRSPTRTTSLRARVTAV